MNRAWLLLALFAAGCNSVSRHPPIEIMADMKHQPKILAQVQNRRPVEGTVASDDPGPAPAANPLPVVRANLERGRERYDIYCAPCHDRSGTGRGIVSLRSNWLAGNLHDQRIRDLTDGQLYDTITNGKRTMPAYRFQVEERDRWAIILYVRALQRAWTGTVADVPPELRSDLR